MQNIIPFWQPQRCLSTVLTEQVGNVSTPAFQIGQMVDMEFFSNDPLDTEHFMQTFHTKGLVVGIKWDGCEWMYFLHFEFETWFQLAGYESYPMPQSLLKPTS